MNLALRGIEADFTVLEAVRELAALTLLRFSDNNFTRVYQLDAGSPKIKFIRL